MVSNNFIVLKLSYFKFLIQSKFEISAYPILGGIGKFEYKINGAATMCKDNGSSTVILGDTAHQASLRSLVVFFLLRHFSCLYHDLDF